MKLNRKILKPTASVENVSELSKFIFYTLNQTTQCHIITTGQKLFKLVVVKQKEKNLTIVPKEKNIYHLLCEEKEILLNRGKFKVMNLRKEKQIFRE